MNEEMFADVVGETINIGVGEAAASLSELVNSKVIIQVPEIKILNTTEVREYVRPEIESLGVFISQEFHGLIEGKALLAYSRNCSISLLSVLYDEPRDMNATTLTTSDIAVLQEVGNIIIVSCMSTISNIIGEKLYFTLPEAVFGGIERYFELLSKNIGDFEKCIAIKNEMRIKEIDVKGYIFILISLQGLRSLTNKIVEAMSGDIE